MKPANESAATEGKTSQLTIRLLGPKDRAELIELAKVSTLPSLSDLGFVDRLLHEGYVFGAIANNSLIGCSAILPNYEKTFVLRSTTHRFPSGNFYFCAAFVRPEARGEGVGTLLYRRRLDFATSRYCGPIVVELLGDGNQNSVHPGSISGLHFHLQHGFNDIGYSNDPDGGKVLGRDLHALVDLKGEPAVIDTNICALLAARGMRDLPSARQALADTLLRRGFSRALVHAMTSVPRHAFVSPEYVDYAYLDRYLWTSETVLSTPSVVAQMIQALELNSMKRVLEIGTGTGYQTAVLALLAGQVFSIDRVPRCIGFADLALRLLGITNAKVKLADGYAGWPEEAPFDSILVATAPRVIPQSLVDQLSPQYGLMVLPVGDEKHQRLTLVRRIGKQILTRDLGSTYFVPMVPTASWNPTI